MAPLLPTTKRSRPPDRPTKFKRKAEIDTDAVLEAEHQRREFNRRQLEVSKFAQLADPAAGEKSRPRPKPPSLPPSSTSVTPETKAKAVLKAAINRLQDEYDGYATHKSSAGYSPVADVCASIRHIPPTPPPPPQKQHSQSASASSSSASSSARVPHQPLAPPPRRLVGEVLVTESQNGHQFKILEEALSRWEKTNPDFNFTFRF